MIVFGIDPGSRFTGWAVIDYAPSQSHCIAAGRIVLKQNSFTERLMHLHSGLTEVIQEHQPVHIGIETVFVQKNVQSALKLGQARGVALLACAQHGVEPIELSARFVKQCVTGSGSATKQQVASMIRRIMGLNQILSEDASDALSIALSCGHMVYTSQKRGVSL
ncbi:crossover junction endodeoxyribonuclease RuvC [Candidatus Comchoanobacter bicostacola]|uniref:Crossover junction endodeoxyribonuclease RuvC n=1 Tax=Candidatus Comchoanobacter bicostacola TaxID=2919598 RepID=A0ABY5DJV1_9GAMM|nr:crossover junction endodeoxyribonuclease RuvC [Candidatus Comchoanobacter bicostacola]UTC24440.1 crossover junction endodeoxyribonuclease RuvC [Candidatus Comchoanobacter bicostacola]